MLMPVSTISRASRRDERRALARRPRSSGTRAGHAAGVRHDAVRAEGVAAVLDLEHARACGTASPARAASRRARAASAAPSSLGDPRRRRGSCPARRPRASPSARSAVGVERGEAAGHDDDGRAGQRERVPDRLARLRVGLAGDGARVDDDDVAPRPRRRRRAPAPSSSAAIASLSTRLTLQPSVRNATRAARRYAHVTDAPPMPPSACDRERERDDGGGLGAQDRGAERRRRPRRVRRARRPPRRSARPRGRRRAPTRASAWSRCRASASARPTPRAPPTARPTRS